MRLSRWLSQRKTLSKTREFSLLQHLSENSTPVQLPPNTLANSVTTVPEKVTRLYCNKHSAFEGESMLFENNKYDIIECNNKGAWSDHKSGYCHLCRDPIGGSLNSHVGDRDHTSLQVCVMLSSIFPRSWKPQAVLRHFDDGDSRNVSSGGDSSPSSPSSSSQQQRCNSREEEFRRRLFSRVFQYATNSSNCDHLHIHDDTMRRAELEALLIYLIDGGTMARYESVLDKWSTVPEEYYEHGYSSREPLMSEPASQSPLLPNTAISDAPINLDANGNPIRNRRHPHAVLTHSITEPNGSFPFWYSGERMWKRHMIKMLTMMLPPMQAGILTNFSQKCWGRVNGERMFDALNIHRLRNALDLPAIPENKERKAFFVRAILWELVSAKMRPNNTPVTDVLIDITIRRFCFEMIFLQTMVFMNKVQDVMENLEYIEYEDLKRMNLW